MEYAGEHTGIGLTGHILIILSFVFAGLSAVSYFISTKQPQAQKWLKQARLYFWGHVSTSLSFIIIIFFLLVNHYYEFEYIWEHSSEDMSFRYLLVCFWGGQEGSFMLWIFWHLVLGSIMLFTSKKFEPYVMSVFCLVQFFLLSMLLGVYIGDFKIGSSPFALRREADEAFGPLWNLIPDYMSFDDNFKQGNGLNPLLRNYWMTIHPPTLFLGFALTLIPFCYAIAGLWTKQIIEWIKPALPWTFAGIMVLGAGILMGGAWAYESLSFGGFWAWDPVENASFVPWIIMVGAAHLMLLNRTKNNSIYTTFIFTLFTFIFILVSTFLTRSGILGDTSVHSFTGNDMMGQLLLILGFFTWLSLHMLMFNQKMKFWLSTLFIGFVLSAMFLDIETIFYQVDGFTLGLRSILFGLIILTLILFLVAGYNKSFPKPEVSEENMSSRDFWMFIAALVLCLSAFHIIYNTSLPAFNKVFGTTHTIPQDERNEFYNRYQSIFAIVIALIMGFTQYLKYKKTDLSQLRKDLLISAGLSLVLGGLMIPMIKLQGYFLTNTLLLFSSVFAIVANIDFGARILKGKIKKAGSSIAHVGFGLILLGSLLSQAGQQTISRNYKGYVLDFLSKDRSMSNEEDVQLFKGEVTSMGNYFVVYKDKNFDKEENHLYYNIDYLAQLPLQYKRGDRVRFNFEVFECNADHTAQNRFTDEMNYWKPIEAKSSEEFFSYPTWESHKPGEKLFTLTPFVQLNPKQTVAEPGTKHFFSYDVFTHIKYADLQPTDNNGKMQGFKMTGKIGDTLWTAGYKILLENASGTGNDSLKQFGAKLKLKVLHVLDRLAAYPFYVHPEYVVDSTGKLLRNDKAEIKPLGLEFKITNISANDPAKNANNPSQNGTFELEFVTPEYIVLHARMFPWINILWIGCIVMCIGTTIAIINRIQLNRNAKNTI